MVFTVSVHGGWSRRSVLGAGTIGAASALAGCSWIADDPPPPPPDPLEPMLAATRVLATSYGVAITAHPELADRLRPLHETHLAHETALADLIGRPELASASPPAVDLPPVDPGGALAALREAERDGQDAATRACLSAPPERAALLGSIAAARATHAVVLAA